MRLDQELGAAGVGGHERAFGEGTISIYTQAGQ